MKHPRFWHRVRWFTWTLAWYVFSCIGLMSTLVLQAWLLAAIWFVLTAVNGILCVLWFDLIQEARHEQQAFDQFTKAVDDWLVAHGQPKAADLRHGQGPEGGNATE